MAPTVQQEPPTTDASDLKNSKANGINTDNIQKHAKHMTFDHLSQYHAWNRPLPPVVNKCIHTEIELYAFAHPDKLAIDAWDGKLTYSQLNEFSNNLASELRARGVGPEIIVPLCFPKSKWMIVSMVAVLKAGGAFVSLDPLAPFERQRSILEQAGSKVGLAAPDLAHILEDSLDGELLEVGEFNISEYGISEHKPKHGESDPSSAAYVVFTSGSTGNPKGVVVEHRSFCSGVALHAPAQYMHSESRILQFASFSGDFALVEIFATLLVGGTLCMPSEEDKKANIATFINKMSVTWAVMTPTFITTIRPSDVPTLKTIVLAGESLSPANIKLWSKSVDLLSGYGLSECSAVATISKPLTPETSPRNVGLPAGGVLWIVDAADHEKLLPIGEIGEILVEGPTLSRGYLKNPEATKKVFIDAPQWLQLFPTPDTYEKRFYKTGDLGRYNEDGTLDFISRKDSRVELATGETFELTDVEYNLAIHPEVPICLAAFPRAGRYANKLVALLQLRPAPKGKEHVAQIERVKQISTYLTRDLPSYMVPQVWLVVAGIPRLPSAKTDRKMVNKWVESLKIGDAEQKLYHISA